VIVFVGRRKDVFVDQKRAVFVDRRNTIFVLLKRARPPAVPVRETCTF
jgi:hypothetical protein